MPDQNSEGKGTFWSGLSGVIAAITSLIVAVTALIGGLVAAGWIGGDDDAASNTSSTTSTGEAPSRPGFVESVHLVEGGDDFLRFGFTTSSTTSYRSTVAVAGGDVVWENTGTATAGQRVVESAAPLEPGTRYRVLVALDDDASIASAPLQACTAGVVSNEPVRLQNLRVTEKKPEYFRLDYTSNICANGSFVIRLTGSDEIIGSNAGQARGSVTAHWAIPGIWTDPLQPETSYTVELTVEANGRGLGDGNVDSERIEVTTAPAE